MISRDSLVSAPTEVIEVLLIQRTHNISHIVTVIIPGVSDFVWRRHGGNRELRRGNYKSFVHEDVCTGRVVNGHQFEMVIIVCFPQLSCKSKVVVTVVRDKLISTDFVPFFGRRNLGCTQVANPQPDCGAPRNCVLNKLHLLAVIGKKERAGPFQALFRGNSLIAFEVEFSSDRPVWPYNSDNVGAGLFAQAEMNDWSCYGLFLNQ